MSETYVVVGFRVDQERSVLYKKCRGEDEMVRAVVKAFTEKGAHFISIRRIVRVMAETAQGMMEFEPITE